MQKRWGAFIWKRGLSVLIAILCIFILGELWLVRAPRPTSAQTIGEYTIQVPSDWQVKCINALDHSVAGLEFREQSIFIGGVQKIGYYPDQPLFLPNHSETVRKSNIEGLVAQAVLFNLKLTQPAASGDRSVKNENHLFLIFPQENFVYDIYANSRYVSETELINIGKSLQKQEKILLTPIKQDSRYNAEVLLQSKTKNVGDASAVVKLINQLPLANFRKEVALKTDTRPYGITAKYNFGICSWSTEAIEDVLADNATLLLALIDNVDEISFRDDITQKEIAHFTRVQIQSGYAKDLRDYSKNVKTFSTLLNSLELKLYAFPPQYTLAMSSTPGIRILAQYNGQADKVLYATSWGRLSNGKAQDYGQFVELPYTTPVYWCPPMNETVKSSAIWVKATLINNNVPLADRLLPISTNDSIFFGVQAAPDIILGNPNNPDRL